MFFFIQSPNLTDKVFSILEGLRIGLERREVSQQPCYPSLLCLKHLRENNVRINKQNPILLYLKLASHCEEGFKQLMELLLICFSTNVLVHLNEEEDELMRIIGTVFTF